MEASESAESPSENTLPQDLPPLLISNSNEEPGTSSPDSGVNDLSDDQPVSSVSCDSRYNCKFTVMPNTVVRIQTDDSVRIINGPANISAMIPGNGQLPIRGPGSRPVMQSVDDKGVVHYILTQQPSISQLAAGQLHTFSYHRSQGLHQSGASYSYGAPGNQQQPPFPPTYQPQYHHHPIHPSLIHNGNIPHNCYADERSQRLKADLRDKISHPHTQLKTDLQARLLAMQQASLCHNQFVMPRHINAMVNRTDANSCSNSTDSHEDEERRPLFDLLSSIKTPQLEIESRRAVIQINPPEIPYSLLPIDHSMNPEVSYQIYLREKKDGPYLKLYNGDATKITMNDLKPATEYYVKICATLDDVSGKETEPFMFTTLAAAPDPPQPPKCLNKTKSSILLKWNAATDNGSKITDYVLEYFDETFSAQPTYIECYTGSKKEFRLAKLLSSHLYVFRLAAVNDKGRSEWSKEVRISTSGTVPGKPEAPQLADSSSNSLLLTWAKRSSDKEFFLQQEEENSGVGFLAAYTGPETRYRVENLLTSTCYKFRLSASNDDGKSEWSSTVTYKTRSTQPSPPTKLSVKGKVCSSTFRLVWEPPAEDGGSPVSSYQAQLDDGSGYRTVYNGKECECTCTDLLPGHTYKARVCANSSAGHSRWSEVTQVLTKPICPGICGKPSLYGKPKAHSLHIKWAPPENNGGSAIKEYVVRLRYMDNTTREVYRGHDLDCVVAGLSPGRSYLLQVRAVNAAGEGEWSEAAEVLSGAGVPEAPVITTCCIKSAHSILVGWQAPCNNGAKISDYRLECLQPNELEFIVLYTGAEIYYEAKSLQPNSEYAFRVAAINSSGISSFSEPYKAKTSPSSPAAVAQVKAAATATSIHVNWTKPNDHGSEVTHYIVEYCSQQSLTLPTNQTECIIENVSADTVYRIRVQAVNAIGTGPFSSTCKVVTSLLPPSPPSLECVGFTYNSIRLKWSEVDKCQAYTVWKSAANSEPQAVYNGLSQLCKVGKLNESTEYTFTVSATNSAGEGPQSPPMSVVTSRAPPHSVKAPSVSEVNETDCQIMWTPIKSDDLIEYKLQLAECCSTSLTPSEYKQIYQGKGSSYHLTGLVPGKNYSVRVCPIRLCGLQLSEAVVGAFSPGTMFKISKPLPPPEKTVSESISKVPVWRDRLHRAWRSVRPEQDKQYALMFVTLAFLLSILVSMIVSYVIG